MCPVGMLVMTSVITAKKETSPVTVVYKYVHFSLRFDWCLTCW